MGGAKDFYLQDEPQAGTQRNELSVDFFNLTISDHDLILPSVPVAQFTAPMVREFTPAFNMVAPHVRGPAAASQIHANIPHPSITASLFQEPTTIHEPIPANAFAVPCGLIFSHAAPHIHEPTAVHEPAPANIPHRLILAIAAPRIHEPTAVHETTPANASCESIPTIVAPRIHKTTTVRESTPASAIAALTANTITRHIYGSAPPNTIIAFVARDWHG
jgi:hypothetical protein